MTKPLNEKELLKNVLYTLGAYRELLIEVEKQIGWRSNLGEELDQYYCEYCGSHSDLSESILHTEDCLVTRLRSTLGEHH